ncbi:hypothetical protein [Phormidium tenue]|uniref:Uncharacterized protein n=1 Tax=Phormidium tenue NIES-30 TaxID=549789 RepID=A0A1U7IY20_9CYAN|nr:hypothetical protein [Phormidium tenue]MBD2233292.1 hypothetical protein [Phormidium tenue FACHB-1052]OKH43276.1 hypothetical protein NIES30_25330 [Phormidium tenue NIES-30]
MKDKLQQRLQALKTEFETGQKMLVELDTKRAELQQTLLRIGGAIQVLEEVLSEIPAEDGALSDGPSSGGAIAPPQSSGNLTL